MSRFLPSASIFPGGELILAVALIIVALALIFVGRTIIKALIFIVAGLAGAALASILGGVLLGPIGALIGLLVGFILGGLLGVLLLSVGIAVALGYAAYSITDDLIHLFPIAIVVGVVFFILGLVLANKIIELVSALLGAIILATYLPVLGVPAIIAWPLALILAVLGFIVQERTHRRPRPPPPPAA